MRHRDPWTYSTDELDCWKTDKDQFELWTINEVSLAWIEEGRPLVVDGKSSLEGDRSVIREFVYNFGTHLKEVHCRMRRTPIIMRIIIWVNWTRSKIQKIIWYLLRTAKTLNNSRLMGLVISIQFKGCWYIFGTL